MLFFFIFFVIFSIVLCREGVYNYVLIDIYIYVNWKLCVKWENGCKIDGKVIIY